MKAAVLALSLSLLMSLSSPSFAQAPTPLLSTGVQERIILMRHAEKPEEKHDPNLTAAGERRSQLLARYIVERYGKPDYIFAAANSRESMRPLETATPLANATGVPVDASFKNDDYAALASTLLNDPKFVGKTIVVVWHHGNLPDFADSLHAKHGTFPSKWSGHDFNQFLQFDYVGKHHPLVNLETEPF